MYDIIPGTYEGYCYDMIMELEKILGYKYLGRENSSFVSNKLLNICPI